MAEPSDNKKGDYNMNEQFVNMYIESLVKEVTEGVKSRILLETQLKFAENFNKELQAKLEQAEAQLEKLNKKKPKEVNTSDTF
jgi:uncharacterized membrane-anchored protein